ncbi:MAG: carboxypeptidase-like regulatory domain-containing protein, partial [Acidimicrobiales bacterium]
MFDHRRFLLALLILASVGPAWKTNVHSQLQTTITISGTVTGPGGAPVVGATVGAWLSTDEEDSAITNAAGFYELTLLPGDVAMHVRPPLASRLAERHIYIGYRDTSFTQDLEVVAGYLLSGTVFLPNGDPPDTEFMVAFDPVSFSLPDGEWLGAATVPGSGEFQAVAPVGVYWVGVTPLPPYYPTGQPIDLTSGDVTGVVLTVGDEPVPHIRIDPPPNADFIYIGTADDSGVAAISGDAGAVPGLHTVILTNLDTGLYTTTLAAGNGSFSTTLFAPPGTHIAVKYSDDPDHINNLNDAAQPDVDADINPITALPTTILRVPLPSQGSTLVLDKAIPFGAAGRATDTPGKSDARWWISGT